MKKTTRILLFSAVTAASFGAQAQSGQELIVVAKDAEGTAIGEASVSTASRLCFSEKGVEVVSGEVLSAVFDYSALQTISFRCTRRGFIDHYRCCRKGENSDSGLERRGCQRRIVCSGSLFCDSKSYNS